MSIVWLLIPINKGKLEITFFDVGQGDAIYIKAPNGQRVLIDGGEDYTVSYKLAEKFVFPFCTLDYIFITHMHADHYGGLKKVTQNCDATHVTFNDIGCDSKTCNYFSELLTKNSIKKDDLISLGDVSIKVLWPDIKNDNVNYSNVNNSSLVLFLDYGDFEALFTGDAEVEALKEVDIKGILPYIQGGLDVYKASHHGALNGLYKPLLVDVAPITCIISVGKNNKYGHPSSEVLSYFESIHCNTFRTDEIGDITFIF